MYICISFLECLRLSRAVSFEFEFLVLEFLCVFFFALFLGVYFFVFDIEALAISCQRSM